MIQAYLAKWAAQYGTRAVGLVAALCAVLALYWYIVSLRSQVATEAVRANTAQSALALERGNTLVNQGLVKEIFLHDQLLSKQVNALRREVAKAKVPVPVECEPVFAPIRAAISGVRELRRPGGVPLSTSDP